MAQKDSFFLSGKKHKAKEANMEKKGKIKQSENKSKRHEKFDNNRDGIQEEQEKEVPKGDSSKKPFDKKTYRLKKYSMKYKLQQFEDHRKHKLLKVYYKSLKDDVTGVYKPKAFDEDTTDSNKQEVGKFVRHPDLIESDTQNKLKLEQKSKKDPFWKAKEHFKQIQQDKLNKKEKAEEMRQTRAQKIAEYKKKKQERFKKLSVKNKKGQPVMGFRMELLLDRMQKTSN